MVKPYLPKGAKTYRIHPRVPVEYQAAVGAKHVTRSLGTGDLREAKRRVPAAMQKLISDWDALLAKTNAATKSCTVSTNRITAKAGFYFDNLEHACAYFYERARLVEAVQRGMAADRIVKDPESFWRGEIVPLPDVALDAEPLAAAATAYRHWARERHNTLAAKLSMGRLEDVQQLVRVVFNPPHSDDPEFVLTIARALLSFLDRVANDDTGIYWYVDEIDGSYFVRPPGGVVPCSIPVRTSKPNAPKLSEVCEAYLHERGENVSAERADTLNATVRDFIAVVGDKPITSYGKGDANAFKSVLLALPGNWIKRKELREHGIVEASRRAANLGLPRQAPDTLKKKWSALGCVFAYAEANHDGVKNCFVRRSLAVSDGQPANEKGSPFTASELKVLRGSLHLELPSHLYWLTLLGLYTGARLNELCQLRKSLIRQHGGTHYIYFSPDLRLKTGSKDSCVRAVPIHAHLIELGFLDYVSSCSDTLFPGLPQHKSGRFSDAPSKAFTRFLRVIRTKRPKLSFHSLRHTFVAALKRNAPRDAETRERLVGHALQGLAGRYGDSYRAEAHDMALLTERAKVLNKLEFGIDLPVSCG